VQNTCFTLPVFSPSDQENPLVLREQSTARANRAVLDKLGRPVGRQPSIPPNERTVILPAPIPPAATPAAPSEPSLAVH
jgi:hypothetical protein